jgi:beta-glucosidase
VVQVYVRAPGETDARLAGFAGIRLAAGCEGEARVLLEPRTWERWDAAERGWTVPPGRHEVLVGRSAEEIAHVLEHQV